MSASRPLEVFCTIDARESAHADPVERMLEVLESLPHGRKMVMLASVEPRALFRVFGANGFDYRSRYLPAGYFEVTVWHAADTASASAGLE